MSEGGKERILRESTETERQRERESREREDLTLARRGHFKRAIIHTGLLKREGETRVCGYRGTSYIEKGKENDYVI